MGIEGIVGPRKHRQAEKALRMKLGRIAAINHDTWDIRVENPDGTGHVHIRVDPHDWTIWGTMGCIWSSCRE